MSTDDDPPAGSPPRRPDSPAAPSTVAVSGELSVPSESETSASGSSSGADAPASIAGGFAPVADAPAPVAGEFGAVSDAPASVGGGFAPLDATGPHASPPSRDSEPILPTDVDGNMLSDAVGSPSRKSRRKPPRSERAEKPEKLDEPPGDDPDASPRMSRKLILVIAASILVGAGIVALVLLGRVNSERYFLTCTTKEAIAEQGRAFPPWGARQLSGAEWRPIALPPNAQCKSEELDDPNKLGALYLDLLLERTSAALAARNFLEPLPADTKPGGAPLDLAAAQLEQALLLSRGPERADQRKQVERLLGDVGYWRASLRLRDATTALADASRQFDAAALQRPAHVSDAGAWAEFLRRLTEELQAGPHAKPADPTAPPPVPDRPGAPQGTALPVEEPPPAAGSDAPPSTPDAGVPTGGVLL